jgi:hypothetical protein
LQLQIGTKLHNNWNAGYILSLLTDAEKVGFSGKLGKYRDENAGWLNNQDLDDEEMGETYAEQVAL